MAVLKPSRLDGVISKLSDLRHDVNGTDTENGSAILDRVLELSGIVAELADATREKCAGLQAMVCDRTDHLA